MRLNQEEEDLFKGLENFEFDFSLSDDIKKLSKKEKEKVLKDLKEPEDETVNPELDDEEKQPE